MSKAFELLSESLTEAIEEVKNNSKQLKRTKRSIKIEPIKKFMKEILVKYNKESYLQGKLEIEEVINYGA